MSRCTKTSAPFGLKNFGLTMVFAQLFLCASCGAPLSKEEKLEIVRRHVENTVLKDIILIYQDKHSTLPDSLGQIVDMYRTGESSFGFDPVSIERYIWDPFSGARLKYFRLGKNEFILYSVGPDRVDDSAENIDLIVNLKSLEGSFKLYDEESEKGDVLIYYYSPKNQQSHMS